MKHFRPFLIALSTFVLISCGGGGGGDDSSTGAGSSGNTTVNLAQFAGTYVGTITATVIVDGGTETLIHEITIVISDDGQTITIESVEFSLADISFTETVAIPLTSEGVVCTLDATITGMISVDLISGAVSGSGNCIVNGVNVTGQLTGYSGASKI